MFNWTVPPAFSGVKLIDFVKQMLPETHSAREIKRALEQNGCRVNGRSERFASHLVGNGDLVQFHFPEEQGKGVSRARILFQDLSLFAYDKPPGTASDDPEFLQQLAQFAPHLKLVHRLDKETSGVLLFAKSEEIRLAMIALFQEKQVKKTYYALIDGELSKNGGVVDNYLGKLQTFAGQAIWGEVDAKHGLAARTEWNVEKRGFGATLVRVCPITGRTHQIRVHLSSLGHPILGDHLYGRSVQKSSYLAPRCLLHAYQVEFRHPVTHQQLLIQAPFPEDFKKALNEACP